MQPSSTAAGGHRWWTMKCHKSFSWIIVWRLTIWCRLATLMTMKVWIKRSKLSPNLFSMPLELGVGFKNSIFLETCVLGGWRPSLHHHCPNPYLESSTHSRQLGRLGGVLLRHTGIEPSHLWIGTPMIGCLLRKYECSDAASYSLPQFPHPGQVFHLITCVLYSSGWSVWCSS